MKLKGKIAWITGASSGIGEALASELFNRGVTVILSARNVSRLNDQKTKFDAIEAGRCFVIPMDVTKADEIHDATENVKNTFNRLDIMVNNAGVSQRALALETELKIDREIFEVNFFGTISVTKDILPWMISTGGGNVVVISSMAGKYGFPMRSAYAASKHALHGYFETLRAELHDKKIKVTMICPGRIKTAISINSLTGNGQRYGIMDKGQLNGIPVDQCARIIVHAITHGRKEVFIGRGELFLLAVKRVCPVLYYWLVNHVNPI
jgi:short-subunit dehydrogenase